MSNLSLSPARVSSFGAHPRLENQRIHVTMTGSADLEAVASLRKFLEALHPEALRLQVSEVVIGLEAVDFMNSSCFKQFVSWINRVQGLGEAEQYQIRILSNPAMHWQSRSLHALKCFAYELITIEEV